MAGANDRQHQRAQETTKTTIRSFKTRALKNLYTDGFHKKKSENLANSIVELLDHLHAARLKKDLNIRGFHELKGDRKGTYAWKVTANMRLTFRFEKGDAFGVALEDDH